MEEFRFIYYDEYEIGKMYEEKTRDGRIVLLGVLVKKELTGRVYDQDIELTFRDEKGNLNIMEVDFGHKYRVYHQ
jgi:hypothetical protein